MNERIEKPTEKEEMVYLEAVADFLNGHGYEVSAPDKKHLDLLDVWGFLAVKGGKRRRRCFHEIYVTIHRCKDGLLGHWHVDYDNVNELIEVVMLDNELIDEYDLLSAVKEMIEPIKKTA